MKKENKKAFFLYLLLICLIYPQVVFLGKSLIASLYYPEEFIPPQYQGKKPLNIFNIDLGTPAFYEVPVNKLAGSMYLKGEFPLWNPYQGCGTPLLAQYSSRVLFPYQILEDISPYWLWDYFILGRLLISGFFTFLFLRLLGLNFFSSFLGGIFYTFSGSFVWFINLEQFTNVAMALPIFIYCLERLYKFNNYQEAFLLSLALFLVMAGGQPEIALYVLFLGGVYYLFRARFSLDKYPKFILACLLGSGFSLPLLIPFLEFTRYYFTAHPFSPAHPLVHMGTVSPTPLRIAISLFMPKFFEMPTWFRITPANGVWDFLGGYIHISCLYLIILGLFLRYKNKKFFLFFLVFGLGIILKNFGIIPFKWLGYLPLFRQSWSPRWAGCVWNFSLATAAALTLQGLEEVKNHKRLSLFPIFIIIGLIIYLFWQTNILQNLHSFTILFSDNIYFPVVLGTFISLLILYLVFLLVRFFAKDKFFYLSLLLLVGFESWFYIPRGFGYPYCNFTVIPLIFGILGLFFLVRRYFKLSLVSIFLGLFSVISIHLISPQDFPSRKNPFPSLGFTRFLKDNLGKKRFLATQTIFFPNFASAYGLSDVKFINSISIEWYQKFAERLLPERFGGWEAGRLWFTTIPLNWRGLSLYDYYQNLLKNLKYYSLLGVKYVVTPKSIILPLPLVYTKEVKVYENPYCFPRVFVVRDTLYAQNWQTAQDLLDKIDLRKTAVLEKPLTLNFLNSLNLREFSYIKEYKPSKVLIETQLEKPGLLILTDVFYPGWRVYVDGKEEEILRVDGLLRGVYLKEGKHEVVFFYRPWSFIWGCVGAGGSLLIGVLTLFLRRRR